jgi:hypothetical protein
MKPGAIALKLREIGEPEMAGMVESHAMVVGYLKHEIKKDKQEMDCDKPCKNCEIDSCPNRALIEFMVDVGIEL